MRCFEKLVKSRFLANVSKELEMARRTLESASHPLLPDDFVFDKGIKKLVYDQVAYEYFLLEELSDTVDEMTEEDNEMIYYIQLPDLVFIYSAKKAQLKEAVRYTLNVNGDLPLYTTKHRIKGLTFYTALIDTRYKFLPPTNN
jgi:hypothetical protein